MSRVVSFLIFIIVSNVANSTSFEDKPIIMIGSSYFNGNTRIDDDGIAALEGIAVGFGSYLSLGDSLIQNNILTINEARVGSTTFDRYSCVKNKCISGGKILGYESQYKNALKRVYMFSVNKYNAKYMLIGLPNDCIHSDAFGIPQELTNMCTKKDMLRAIKTIVNIAKDATSKGFTVIATIPPKYNFLDLDIVKNQLNMSWVIDEKNYNTYRELYSSYILENAHNINLIDIWKEFNHRGDGIHPDKRTVKNATKIIIGLINNNEK